MAVRTRTERARRLRRDSTDAERLLWRALRELKLPVNVRRQHSIGPFFADFAIPARKLVIELAGGQHAERREGDAQRSSVLAAHGYRVIRFWNNEVLQNLEGVLQAIVAEIGAPHLSPALSAPEGQRGSRKRH